MAEDALPKITFPKGENDSVRKRLDDGKKTYSIRVSDEFEKFKRGDVVETPWGDRVRIVQSKILKDIDEYEFADELTDEQIKQIGKYDEIQMIGMKKVD